MATCKDCVHAEVCRFKDLPAPLSDSYIRESECIEKRCGNFKDRSRFVELPCKLGDEISCTIFHLNSELLCGMSGTFIDGDFVAFYHEERLYSVKNRKTGIVFLVYANSYSDAIRRVKNV